MNLNLNKEKCTFSILYGFFNVCFYLIIFSESGGIFSPAELKPWRNFCWDPRFFGPSNFVRVLIEIDCLFLFLFYFVIPKFRCPGGGLKPLKIWAHLDNFYFHCFMGGRPKGKLKSLPRICTLMLIYDSRAYFWL